MTRKDGRILNELRQIRVEKNYIKHAQGSCLIEFGDTRVVCTAVLEDNVPPFLKNTGNGWVTGEYGMLPGSCVGRVKRDKTLTSGRTLEIQRLIGRSLRAVVDTHKIGERTIKVDCDVIQADGGTRTASITGGFIALALALSRMKKEGLLTGKALLDYVAAVSVGIYEGQLILDLNYVEDSNAQMDMNVVMVGAGKLVEVQGTAEGDPFTKIEMNKLLDIAEEGIKKLFMIQRKELEKENIF